MSEEPPPKRVRKGTRSCIECRHRKVKCVWPSETSDVCRACLARGKPCEQQIWMTTAAEMAKDSSRTRISHLEGDVTRLWSAVQALETKLGLESSGRKSSTPHRRAASHIGTPPNEDDEGSETSELSPMEPSNHLLNLFENRMLGSEKARDKAATDGTPSTQKSPQISALKQLLPVREDMLAIIAHASDWLSMFSALFPALPTYRSQDEMLVQYDKAQRSELTVTEMASLLVSIAITIQQAPADVLARSAEGIQDGPAYVHQVSDTVERVVVYDDAIAATLDGIETTLLFIRLQLGRARIKKMWLLLKRVIALAQLLGLPRASLTMESRTQAPNQSDPPATTISSPNLHLIRRKAELWTALCAIDRISSMLWSLPTASQTMASLRQPILDPATDSVVPRAFLHHLADIGAKVLELDSLASAGRPVADLFNATLATDQELRALANGTPREWWSAHSAEVSAEALLQYWWFYVSARAHLHLALLHDEGAGAGNGGGGQQFPFSFAACTESCEELARRYAALRLVLPAGFFCNPIVDLQSMTAGVFLLLTGSAKNGSRRGSGGSQATRSLPDQIISTMESAAQQTGGAVARRAVAALHALRALLVQKSPAMPSSSQSSAGAGHTARNSASQQKLTLNLPLVGRIHVSRKKTRGGEGASSLRPSATSDARRAHPLNQQNEAQVLMQTTPPASNTASSSVASGPATQAAEANLRPAQQNQNQNQQQQYQQPWPAQYMPSPTPQAPAMPPSFPPEPELETDISPSFGGLGMPVQSQTHAQAQASAAAAQNMQPQQQQQQQQQQQRQRENFPCLAYSMEIPEDFPFMFTDEEIFGAGGGIGMGGFAEHGFVDCSGGGSAGQGAGAGVGAHQGQGIGGGGGGEWWNFGGEWDRVA